MLGAVAATWPHLLEVLGARPPLVINGYPAATGDFAFGIQVDTYLSIAVGLRALRLANREGLTAIVIAQPLWAAELLLAVTQDAEQDDVLPAAIILAVGGYPLPQSLERCLIDRCAGASCRLEIVQLYGVAELDAGTMIGRERTAEGRVVFVCREDVRVADGPELEMARRGADGRWSAWYPTGDRVDRVDDPHGRPGLTLRPGTRVLSHIERELESWDDSIWDRRTGYLRRDGEHLVAQLRTGRSPRAADVGVTEEDFHDFARASGKTWLNKPDWRCDEASIHRPGGWGRWCGG